jgi:hypothetical protein
MNHRYKKNGKDFFVGRVEKDVVPPHLCGEELHDIVSKYGDIVFGFQSGKQKFPDLGLTHNWVKRSIYGSFIIERPIFSAITLTSYI